MTNFLFNQIVEVKRYSQTLGQYNRPTNTLNLIGAYACHKSEGSSNTSQLQTQKQSNTVGTLYTEPHADIQTGDILYVYDIDEYGNPILLSCEKYVADKPYKKRTKLITPLLRQTEV